MKQCNITETQGIPHMHKTTTIKLTKQDLMKECCMHETQGITHRHTHIHIP